MNRIQRTRLTGAVLAATLTMAFWQSYPSSADSAEGGASGWRPPLDAPIQLVNSYRQPNSDYSAGHRGVDYRVWFGQPIFAPVDGQIWFSGQVVDRRVLTLKTSRGELVEFEPACSSLRAGDSVLRGQVIANACDADPGYRQHCPQLRCLHVSLRSSGGYLSPLVRYTELSPSVLLPRNRVSF